MSVYATKEDVKSIGLLSWLNLILSIIGWSFILSIFLSITFSKADDSIPNIRPYDYNKYGYCVTGKFGEDRGGASHAGIDYGLFLGTSINATADGVVEYCAMKGKYGFLIIIDHKNGYHTYYAHLYSPLILKGMEVKKGQIIALSGNSGGVPSHLHYSCLKTIKDLKTNKILTSYFIFPYVH